MEDDGAFTIDDFNLMDQLLDDGFWLETTHGSDFCLTASTDLNCSSHHFPTLEANIPSFITNPEESLSKETEKSNFLDSNHPPSSHLPQMDDDFFWSRGQNNEPAFLVQDTQVSRRLWVGPNKNRIPIPSSSSTTTFSVKKRLLQAINYLKDSIRDEDVLIQLWIPVKRGDRQVLTTNNQPYSLNPNCCKNLADYRDISRKYQFAVDDDSQEFVGLPGRVFLKKLPEWTPDVRFFKREEYPRVNHAQQYDVRGSLALPVFQLGSGNCLGVVEIVTTSQKINYCPELENVCKALQAVDLKSSDILSPPNIEDRNEAYQAALTEIRKVLKCACEMHKLPLAQTWVPCIQQGKGGHRHSDENYGRCISTIDNAYYVSDAQVSGFHEACSLHHLLKGEGIAGKAFLTNKPCFAKDMTAFRKTEYPLAHHARVFNLCAAVAVRLRSTYTGKYDFVLEFFLPQDCKDDQDQKLMLDSLSSVIQQTCQSLRIITDQELAQETSAGTFNDEMYPRLVPSGMMDIHQHKGKEVVVSLGHHHKEEGEGEFQEVHNQFQQQDSGLSRSAANSTGNVFLAGGNPLFVAKTSSEKRRAKTEKTISLQVLRQYFAGSLKDAAKSIGVCPTTLKRICRQHGITRWPSRKIKKVGHSLRKLQLVMDSVQGTEGGSMKLTSFYNNFPELVSPNVPASSSHLISTGHHLQLVNTQPPEQGTTLLNPATTAPKSSSSSASHSSSSSYCHSTATRLKKTSSFPFNGSSSEDAVLSVEQTGGTLKRACSNAELHDLGQEETKLLVRSYSQKICNAESYDLGLGERKLLFRSQSHKILCSPVPKKKNSHPQELHNVATFFRLKVSFGGEKIRLSLKPHWDFKKLQQEVLGRFKMDKDNKVYLKYLDDDAEWVLLTCDADLEECIDIHRSSRSRTIRISLNQTPHRPSLGSSFGSTSNGLAPLN